MPSGYLGWLYKLATLSYCQSSEYTILDIYSTLLEEAQDVMDKNEGQDISYFNMKLLQHEAIPT